MANEQEVAARLRLKGGRQFASETTKAARELKKLEKAVAGPAAKAKELDSHFGFVGKAFGGIVSLGKTAAATLGIVGAGVTALGVKVVHLAMDAFETQTKFDTVFKGMTANVQGFVDDTFKRFGIPKASLEDTMAMFGVFGKSAGVATAQLPKFSEELTQAGLDLSSFYNVDPQEAFSAITSGLAGMIRPLRQYGIFLSQDQVKAEGAAMGLTGTLTDAQKVMIREKLILKQLGDARGDLARTSGSLANQWRGLKGRAQQLLTTLGQGLLPTVDRLVTALNVKLGGAVDYLSNHMDMLQGPAEGVAGAITAIIDKGVELYDGYRQGGFNGALDALSQMGPAAGFVADQIGLAVAVGTDLWVIVRDGVLPGIRDLGPFAQLFLNTLSTVEPVLGFIADHAVVLTPLVAMIVAGFIAWKVVVGTLQAINTGIAIMNLLLAMNPIILIIVAVIALAAAFVVLYQESDKVQVGISQIGDAIGTAIDKGVEFVQWWGELPDHMASAARGAWHWLVDEFKSTWNALTSYWNNLEIPPFTIGGWDTPFGALPSYTTPAIPFPDLPTLHSGGTVTRGGAVNMRPGEEIVYLPPAATVVPMDQDLMDWKPKPSVPPVHVTKVYLDRREIATAVSEGNEDRRARR